MQQRRRHVLKAGGLAAAMALAGCPAGGAGDESSPDGATETPTADEGGSGDGGARETTLTPETAVAGTWNALRNRLWDAAALGRAGHGDAGAAVAEDLFADFEGMNGEYGAHEALEATSESAYEGFEEALGDLRGSLADGDPEAAADAAATADERLRVVQVGATDEVTAAVMSLQALGGRAATAEVLAAAGATDAAATVAEEAFEEFEDSLVSDALERADTDAYGAVESAFGDLRSAADEGDAGAVREAARATLDAAVNGSYALVEPAEVAGVAHVATLRARGRDAAALASLGGPSAALAHAATLNTYRARVHDAAWLTAHGADSRAVAVVENVFAHFEGAAAHDPFEEADGEAYEGFESGLNSLQSAISGGGDVAGAVEAVDSNLVAGIEALAAGRQAAALQSGFFRARLADARELYGQGDGERAASIAQEVFARFEADELGFHETLEETSEDLYHTFEEEHLAALPGALRSGDDGAVETHYRGAQDALLSFEAEQDAALASSAEAAFFVGRAFDAAGLAALDARERGTAVAQDTFGRFEAGAAGFHEALEEADHERYESFEAALVGVRSAAESGGDVDAAARAFNGEAVGAVTAVVGAGGGEYRDAAAGIVGDAFATFEEARVHETLEEADREAYESFESRLTGLRGAISEGGDVGRAADAFADASTRAAFAVAGAVEDAPVDADGQGGGGGGDERELTGGPNVVEGVPDDADHVVEMHAVSFEPESLTVSAGETVAWEFAGGEPHSVTAYEGGIPEGAPYWASGGFDSEEAAREGWENGEGAIAEGQSYVRTFETPGTHEYVCIPHEAAGMVGEIVVEE